MFSVLFLGLLLGLQHALEADHLAAVASLSTRSGTLGDAARQGAAWGIGHSVTLLLFGGLLLAVDTAVTPWIADALESAVGIMLIGLGVGVLRRLRQRRVHFHAHRHGSERHFHAHSHARNADHRDDPHQHTHPPRLPLRALVVGMVHGLAGTAALLVFAIGSIESALQGLGYIAVFGLGSIIGMTALAIVISLPLRWSAERLTWAHNGLTVVFGVLSVVLGVMLLQQSGIELLRLANLV